MLINEDDLSEEDLAIKQNMVRAHLPTPAAASSRGRSTLPGSCLHCVCGGFVGPAG